MSATGRTVVVTGSAKGIGFACAKRFVEEGDTVILLDIDETEGQAAAEELRKTGEARFIRADVADEGSALKAMAEAFAVSGRIDVLVNSAGIIKGGNILDYSIADFDKVIAVNLRGTFICSQAAARYMSAQGSGSIINMSSVNSIAAIPDQPAYCSSKGAINQLTKSMAIALAPANVRVNAVAPGTILTEMARTVLSSPAAQALVKARTPLGRGAEPSEVAGAVFYLAGDDASYVTGEVLVVDGGRTILNYTMPA